MHKIREFTVNIATSEKVMADYIGDLRKILAHFSHVGEVELAGEGEENGQSYTKYLEHTQSLTGKPQVIVLKAFTDGRGLGSTVHADHSLLQHSILISAQKEEKVFNFSLAFHTRRGILWAIFFKLIFVMMGSRYQQGVEFLKAEMEGEA